MWEQVCLQWIRVTSATRPKLRLQLLSGELGVAKLPPDTPLPPWATQSEIYSITKTPDELSIVTDQKNIPEGTTATKNWVALRVAGDPMDFSLVGITESLVTPLRVVKIPSLVIATHDTDYLLVAKSDLKQVVKALEAAGHTWSQQS